MGFDSIRGQEQPVRILSTLIRKGRYPHALLFTGPDGVGKRTSALAFAMAANCTDIRDESADACGGCKSCRKIQSHTHPDIYLTEPSGNFIRVDQIRELISALLLKPCEARVRVVIISDAHRMNPESANALLKLLEEPPDRTMLILTATEDSDLLPTLVSRCHPLRFCPIPLQIIEQFLAEAAAAAPEQAAILAAMSGGSIGKALSAASNSVNWIYRRNWLFGSLGLDIRAHSESKSLNTILAASEKLARHKDLLQDTLELVKTLYRDIIICKYRSDRLIHQDLKQRLISASEIFSTESLLSKIQAVQTTQRNLLANANVRLSLETLMLNIVQNSEI